jgi:opacity protein-like surface antigen
VFASQVFAGLEYRVNDKLGIYTEYRRLTFDKTSDVSDLKTDILLGGLRLRY